jgi:hypothetical protein
MMSGSNKRSTSTPVKLTLAIRDEWSHLTAHRLMVRDAAKLTATTMAERKV